MLFDVYFEGKFKCLVIDINDSCGTVTGDPEMREKVKGPTEWPNRERDTNKVIEYAEKLKVIPSGLTPVDNLEDFLTFACGCSCCAYGNTSATVIARYLRVYQEPSWESLMTTNSKLRRSGRIKKYHEVLSILPQIIVSFTNSGFIEGLRYIWEKVERNQFAQLECFLYDLVGYRKFSILTRGKMELQWAFLEVRDLIKDSLGFRREWEEFKAFELGTSSLQDVLKLKKELEDEAKNGKVDEEKINGINQKLTGMGYNFEVRGYQALDEDDQEEEVNNSQDKDDGPLLSKLKEDEDSSEDYISMLETLWSLLAAEMCATYDKKYSAAKAYRKEAENLINKIKVDYKDVYESEAFYRYYLKVIGDANVISGQPKDCIETLYFCEINKVLNKTVINGKNIDGLYIHLKNLKTKEEVEDLREQIISVPHYIRSVFNQTFARLIVDRIAEIEENEKEVNETIAGIAEDVAKIMNEEDVAQRESERTIEELNRE